MVKYIITYLIIQMVQTDCPNQNIVDNFGVEFVSKCTVYHAKEVKNYKEKTFFNKDSALTFYNDALNQNEITFIRDYKIDSVKFKIVK